MDGIFKDATGEELYDRVIELFDTIRCRGEDTLLKVHSGKPIVVFIPKIIDETGTEAKKSLSQESNAGKSQQIDGTAKKKSAM